MDLFGIGGVVQGASNLATGLLNYNQQSKQFEYQKELNKLQMQREDTQYQRTVNDMRQAGLSPLAMQGLNSSSPLTSANAPQFDSAAIPDIVGIMSSVQEARNKDELDQQDIYAKKLNNLYTSMDFENRLNESRADVISKIYDNLDKRTRAIYNARYGINDSMSREERFAQIIAHELQPQFQEGSGEKFRELEKNPDLFSEFKDYGSPVSLKSLLNQIGDKNILDEAYEKILEIGKKKVEEKIEKGKKKIKDSKLNPLNWF